jgi:hypothetical protein
VERQGNKWSEKSRKESISRMRKKNYREITGSLFYHMTEFINMKKNF